MKILRFVLLVSLIGCAHGKMGMVTQPLDRSKISKSTPIYVMPVTAKGMQVTGDKADDEAKIKQEKTEISDQYHRMIVMELKKRGYNAKPAKSAKSGVALKGNVRRLEHGSGAARFWVGMGAGSSNMYTDFKMIDVTNKKPIGEFEIIATSGGRGGWSAMGSFMKAHLADGAKKSAEYIDKEPK